MERKSSLQISKLVSEDKTLKLVARLPVVLHRRAVIVLCLLLFAVSGAFGDDGRALADEWPVIETFRELELRGVTPLQPNTWPDRSGEILRLLPDEADVPAEQLWADQLRLWIENTSLTKDTVLMILEPGFYGILNNPRDPDDRLYPVFRFGGGMRRGRIEGFVTYLVNLRWAQDSNYRGRQWEGFAGRPDQVYIRTGGEDWDIQLGKDYLAWGENLVLGRAHDPFERLDYHIQLGPFDFSGFAGFLDPIQVSEEIGDTVIDRWANRYLSGHRLEFLSPHLSLALYETILYGGVGRSPEIIYIVPLYWFHAEQLNRGWNDNTIVGGDFQILFSPVRFSFDFMVDDMQVEAEEQGDEEPPEIALATQLDWGTSLFGKWLTLSGRYEGVTNRTYNQAFPYNRYIFMNTPLGSELGNDADRLSARAKFYACPEAILTVEFFQRRDGEGDLMDEWTEPWMDVEEPYNEPFPSGIVQNTSGLILSWQGCFGKVIRHPLSVSSYWDLNFEYGTLENAGHVEGKEDDYWQLDLDVRLCFYPKIAY